MMNETKILNILLNDSIKMFVYYANATGVDLNQTDIINNVSAAKKMLLENASMFRKSIRRYNNMYRYILMESNGNTNNAKKVQQNVDKNVEALKQIFKQSVEKFNKKIKETQTELEKKKNMYIKKIEKFYTDNDIIGQKDVEALSKSLKADFVKTKDNITKAVNSMVANDTKSGIQYLKEIDKQFSQLTSKVKKVNKSLLSKMEETLNRSNKVIKTKKTEIEKEMSKVENILSVRNIIKRFELIKGKDKAKEFIDEAQKAYKDFYIKTIKMGVIIAFTIIFVLALNKFKQYVTKERFMEFFTNKKYIYKKALILLGALGLLIFVNTRKYDTSTKLLLDLAIFISMFLLYIYSFTTNIVTYIIYFFLFSILGLLGVYYVNKMKINV